MTKTDGSRRRSIGAHRSPESQQAILKAAEAILMEDGLAGFSIEAVARRAHAGKPTIYRWWPSRAALLLEVYHHQKQVAPVPDTGSLETDITTFLRELFDHWRAGNAGAVFRSVIAEAQTDSRATDALRAYVLERFAQTAELVRRAQAKGEAADWVSPELTIELLAGFAWNRLLTSRLDESPDELQQLARQICQGLKG